MFEVKNVSFKYSDKDIVKNLNFEIKEGEILGFLGPNGCGKTTTFRLICGLLEPYEGEIIINGEPISKSLSKDISYLIEERALFPKYKVYEMLLFFGRIKGLDKLYLEDKINYYLELLGMSKYKKSKIETLSKGNQQKIQFIACLLSEPKVLVLDEPISGLDIVNAKELMDIIMDLKKKNTIIIFSSHQINTVEKFCDKVCLINQGKIILNGYLSKIKEDFKKQDITIKADNVDIEKIKNISGVISIEEKNGEFLVKVENKQVVKDIFKLAKNFDNLVNFYVSDVTLEEIFLDKVRNEK